MIVGDGKPDPDLLRIVHVTGGACFHVCTRFVPLGVLWRPLFYSCCCAVLQITSSQSGVRVLEAPSVISLESRHGGAYEPGQDRLSRREKAQERLADFKLSPPMVEKDGDLPGCVMSDGANKYIPISEFCEPESLYRLPRGTKHQRQPTYRRIFKDIERLEKARHDTLRAYSFEVGVDDGHGRFEGINAVIVCIKAELSVAAHFQKDAKTSPYK